jgi:hypothetical protein
MKNIIHAKSAKHLVKMIVEELNEQLVYNFTVDHIKAVNTKSYVKIFYIANGIIKETHLTQHPQRCTTVDANSIAKIILKDNGITDLDFVTE